MFDQAATLRGAIDSGGSRRPLRVIAVTSGKGGVGKTHLSANLGVLAAKSGKRVLVIDADLALANVELLFGLRPRYDIRHLLSRDKSLSEVLVQGPHGVCVLPAGSGIQAMTHLTDAQKIDLVAEIDPLEERFDVVLVDTGAGVGDNVVFFAGAAQEALLVVTPEPTSLTDAYTALKVLSQNAGLNHFQVVVNLASGEKQARATFERLVGVSQRFLKARVCYAGFVPRDECMQRALFAGRPIVDLYPTSPASMALESLSQRLFDGSDMPEVHGGMKFLWKRLLRESGAATAE